MANYKTIAILTCWYGPYPWYFPYFIHSCSFNQTIDFVIITDNKDFISDKQLNLKVIFMEINEIKILVSKKLGFKVNIDYPYKLCDFKPANGFLFPDILKKYNFWGMELNIMAVLYRWIYCVTNRSMAKRVYLCLACQMPQNPLS